MLNNPARTKIVLLFGLNFASSLSIVFLNKVLFKTHQFLFAISLSTFHYVVTYLGLYGCMKWGLFERKSIELKKLVLFALAYAPSVPLVNLSLAYNSIPTYQISKAFVTPVTVFIQIIFYKKTFPTKLLLSILVVLIGATATQITDLEFNLIGTIFALLSVLSSTLSQVWIGELQKKHQVSAPQLLFEIMPLNIIFQLLIVGFFEDINPYSDTGLWAFPYSIPSLTVILATGVIALAFNMSLFLLLKVSSAVTYQVAGHVKTACVLLFGSLAFSAAISVENLFSIGVTLIGSWLYSYFKMTESDKPIDKPVT